MTPRPGVVAFYQTAPLSEHEEGILANYREGESRVLEEGMARIESESRFRVLVGFSGPVSLVLVASIAAGLEHDFGRHVCVRWLRDNRGVVDGVAIVETLS